MTQGLRTTRQYATLPSAPTRGPMPAMIGVIVPIERTNLVTNPSIEIATTGYTAVGGSIARSATQQYHGTYSLAVTPGAGTADGAYFGTVALTGGQPYAYSCKFKGVAGVQYKLSIATTGGVDLSITSFVATGRWQWIFGYYLETTTTTRRVYFTKVSSTNVGVFYVDGVQVEAINAGELVSTYIDGDQLGLLVNQQPPAYLWNGTPHASTSVRSALTRAGGTVVNLSFYNFLLTGIIGLGMAAPNNISIPYTILDGARYLRTTKPPRTLTLAGRVQADDWYTYQQSLSDLRAAFDRDLVPLQQPMLLQVEPQDECGTVIGDFATVPCIYAGGLDGDDGNLPQADVAPTFTMYLPYLSGGSGGAALSPQQSIANANYMLRRSSAGAWGAISTGANNTVTAFARARDGTIYIGGVFTTIGGTAANRIARYDPVAGTFSALTTGLNGACEALVIGPDGTTLYVAGQFAAAGGVANTAGIAKWDGSAWSALGTGTGGSSVFALALDSIGNLYAGGSFATMGGVANTAHIARWNGSAWSALSTGTNGTIVNTVAVATGNRIYIGGDFTTAGATAANRIAKWTGTVWQALGTGTNASVQAIAIGLNGIVYAGGGFTTAGGVTVSNVAQWSGSGWSAMGFGLDVAPETLVTGADGLIWAGGPFTTADGVSLADGLALWNGSGWIPPDVDLWNAGTTTVFGILLLPDGSVYVGFNSTGTASAAVTTTTTNDTPGVVYPTITIKGPSSGTARIYQIVNTTIGFGVWLNYTINSGETATLITDPQNPSFTTDFRLVNPTGDLSATTLPGSQPSLLYLTPGSNTLSFFAGSSTVTALVSWQKHYNGLADLVN